MRIGTTTTRGRASGPSSYPTAATRRWRTVDAARRRRTVGAARRWRTIGAALVVLVFVPPLLLLVAGSLREPGLPPPVTPELLPDPVSWAGYRQAAELGGLVRATVNSVLVAALAVPLSVLVAALAGFALTQLPRRFTTVVLAASLVALMVPVTALLAPRFVLFRWLHLTDTLAPLVAPALLATSPLYPVVYYLAFRALPAEQYDACRLADLSPLRTWWTVAMPQVRPVTSGLTALTFLLTWSNFLDPLIYLYDRDWFTLPLALRSLATLDPTNFPVFLAGAVLATLPALVVFGIAQRWFLRDRAVRPVVRPAAGHPERHLTDRPVAQLTDDPDPNRTGGRRP